MSAGCNACGLVGNRRRHVLTRACWNCGRVIGYCKDHGGMARAKEEMEAHAPCPCACCGEASSPELSDLAGRRWCGRCAQCDPLRQVRAASCPRRLRAAAAGG